MIAAWMTYAILVATCACLAAATAERGLRLIKRPARGAWIGAITLACFVPTLATWRSPVPTELGTVAQSYVLSRWGTSGPGKITTRPTIPTAIAVPASSMLVAMDRPLKFVWIAGSIVWSLMLATSAVRVSRRRRTWMPSSVDGVPVLVSRDIGPAMVGIVKPEIVLPAWVTTLAPEQRALVLAHEHEHARSRDPLLLAAAALTLVAMPWNAALWFALGRLRLAVEADCDLRVLHAYPDLRIYSSLLVDVTERNLMSGMHLAALGDSRSQLARRLTLLTARVPRHLGMRALCAALLSVTCVIVACVTPQPTSVSRGAAAAARLRPENRISQQVASHPVIAMSTHGIEKAPLAASDHEDSMFVRPRRGMSRSPEKLPYEELPPVPTSVIRRAVETHYPTALTGEMGRQPYLWFRGDRTNRVLGFATGRAGLGFDGTNDVITWASMVRMVPGTPPAMQRRGDLLQVALLPRGADTVVVVWARLWGEAQAR